MSNIEDLVPPLELCEQIPAGEFTETVFVWVKMCAPCNKKAFVTYNINMDKKGYIDWQIPAPTLQEIMQQLPIPHSYTFGLDAQHKFEATLQENFYSEPQKISVSAGNCCNPVNAALELWLKLKGVEDEN